MKIEITLGSLISALSIIDPASAVGAAFGCMFHLIMPSQFGGVKKVMMASFSWGIGYACGIASASDSAMLIAAISAALGSTAISALHGVIHSGGDAPLWLKYFIETILRVKK